MPDFDDPVTHTIIIQDSIGQFSILYNGSNRERAMESAAKSSASKVFYETWVNGGRKKQEQLR